MTAQVLIAAVLVVSVIRILRSPQVLAVLAGLAGATAAIAVAEGYGVIVLVVASIAAAGTLGPVAFLHQFVVPGRFRLAVAEAIGGLR